MGMEDIKNARIKEITAEILRDYQKGRAIDKTDVFKQPDKEVIVDIVSKLMQILFPGYYRDRIYRSYNYDNRISVLIEDVLYNLEKQIAKLEREIEKQENTVTEYDEKIQEAATDYAELSRLMEEKASQEEVLSQLYTQWENLSGELEA